MSKFMAYLIETLNHDQSLSHLIDPSDKIHNLIKRQTLMTDSSANLV